MASTPSPPGIPDSSPLSPHLELEQLEERLSGDREPNLDERAVEAAREDEEEEEMSGSGNAYNIGNRENYGGDGEGSTSLQARWGEAELDRKAAMAAEIDKVELAVGGEGEEEMGGGGEEGDDEKMDVDVVMGVVMDVDEDVEIGDGEDDDVDSSQPLTTEEGEDEEEVEEGEEDDSEELLLHPGPIHPLVLTPISEEPEVEEEEGDDDDEDMNDVSNNNNEYASNNDEEEPEEGDDTTASFALHSAPSTRRPTNLNNKGKKPIYFGTLGRAIEPEPTSPALSEAETIILSSSQNRNQRSRVLHTDRGTSPSPAPTTGRLPSSASVTTPATAMTPSNLQAWRYKDVSLPEKVPETMAQWARLAMKVRMITPLPLVEVPSKVGVGFVESVRREYEVLMVKEQKRVIEVVRKSKVCGGWDDEWDFLTGSDKKSQQINWDGLSPQALRNTKAILDVLSYEDFASDLAEANNYHIPTSPSSEFKLVKRFDNYWGIGWSFRGSTGKFEDLTEDEMEAYHREVYPKREVGELRLVLGARGEDGRREGEQGDEGPARMQLKDEIKGIQRKVLGRKPGLLVGGEPGSWGFWVQDEDKHLRDWVLAAQGEA